MKKSFLGRSLETARLAKDLAALKRDSNPRVQSNAALHLSERMGAMRGLPMKLGQSLSMTEVDGEAFEPLRGTAEPIDFDLAAAQLQRAWQVPWHEVLAELDTTGLAASLGQVHRGRLKDGQEVAVKIAYPGIREAVLNDLKILGWLGKPAEHFFQGFDMDTYQEVLLNDLEEELDYTTELEQQQRYAACIGSDSGVVVPNVVPSLSTTSVLVTHWEQALPVEQLHFWPEPVRFRLAVTMVRHFLDMLFDHGQVHADPHPGNYRFRLKGSMPQVVLYDYGSIAKVPRDQRLLLLRLIVATMERKGDPLALMTALGFREDLLRPIRHKLPALCRVLFEPFTNDGKYDTRTWNRTARVRGILADDVWNFRLSGPAAFVFLVRGFQGLLFYLEKLGVTVSWYRLLMPVLERHLAEMSALPVPGSVSAVNFKGLARYLHVRLLDHGEQKVALKFPADAVERLDTLMGPDIVDKAKARGIQVNEVIDLARSRGMTPGTLFNLEDGSRRIEVWLS